MRSQLSTSALMTLSQVHRFPSARSQDQAKNNWHSIRRNRVFSARIMAQITQSHQKRTSVEALWVTQRARWSTRRGNRAYSKLRRMTILRSYSLTSAKGYRASTWIAGSRAQVWASVKQTGASSVQMHTNKSQWSWAISSIPTPRKVWSIATTLLWSHSSWRRHRRGAPRKCLRAVRRSYHQITLLKHSNSQLCQTTLRRTITLEKTSPCSIGVGRLIIQPTRLNQA